jgi:hypothetical protein
MQSSGWKGFWFGFWVTALVLVPLVGGTVLLEQRQSQARTQVAQDASGVAVALPKAEDRLAALICVPGDEPAFVLVGLDADANRLALLAVPAECAVPFGDGESTLRACYTAAGPARCVQGLNAALAEAAQEEESGSTPQIERYLALSAEMLAKITEDYGPLRVGLSGVLTAQQLAACGQPEAMQEWEASAAHEFLASQQDWLPTTRAALRAAVWEAFFRQKLEKLPATLPQALRKYSSSLLTDLTAGELYTLEETLEFLADQGAVASGEVLPGTWEPGTSENESGVYRLDAASAAAVQAIFSASAASSQSASASAP